MLIWHPVTNLDKGRYFPYQSEQDLQVTEQEFPVGGDDHRHGGGRLHRIIIFSAMKSPPETSLCIFKELYN